jgi:hypothetical protein
MADKVISFQGTLAVEGDLAKLNMDELKTYLQHAVCLDLDLEEHGQLSEDIEVTGIGIDWDSLKD